MLTAKVKNYSLKNSTVKKKAVFITFQKAPVDSTFDHFRKQLNTLLHKEFDAYIVLLNEPSIINAKQINLLFQLHNSTTKKIGILLKDSCKEIIYNLGLDDTFLIHNDERSLLISIERNSDN